MMLVHDECFRDDVKPFIDLRRKLFITFGEFLREFFFGELMVDDPGRKPVKILLALSFGFGALVG